MERIRTQAESLGMKLKTEVFATRELWQNYAIGALHTVERLAKELNLTERLHLWPDKSLGSEAVRKRIANPEEHVKWLYRWWGRISEWPERSRQLKARLERL